MGRNRGHWPEVQKRPDMSSREVLMIYMYSKCQQDHFGTKLITLFNLFSSTTE